MFYVYLLKSIDYPEQKYIGYTTDIKKRLKQHNSGYSKHTDKFRPWKLHAYFAFETEDLAISFEKYLKTNSGRAFANKRLWT